MSQESRPVLTIEKDGAVRVVTLNRPDALNAFSDELHEAFASVWQELSHDHEARAVVITGAGRAFSAGGDIPGFLDKLGDDSFRRAGFREAGRLVTEMLRFHLPVISAVNGPAVGLGASIAVMADIVYISEAAFISDPHVSIGLVAGDGGAVTWPAMTSILKAKEYLFTGDRISAEEAVRLGLANRMFSPDDLLPKSLAFAHRLAALPPQSLQDTKRAVNLHLQASAQLVMPFATMAEELSFTTPEFQATTQRFQNTEAGA